MTAAAGHSFVIYELALTLAELYHPPPFNLKNLVEVGVHQFQFSD